MTESPIDSDYAALLRELTLLARAVGGGDEAEDIAQETLLHARSRLHQLRDEQLLRPWLRRIAVRRAQRYRRQVARPVVGELVSWAPTDMALGLDVAGAISKLPERERAALSLVYGLGYTQEEAGEALGVQRGTIATLLFRARRKLAIALVDYWKGVGA